jgi:hypothetical protein
MSTAPAMEQQSKDAARAIAFANGLRKNIAGSGRRWSAWPRGANDLARVLAVIDGITERLHRALDIAVDAATIPSCITDLRTVLEWNTYQSASLATARAVIVARRTRAFAERFGVLNDPAANLSILVDSEDSLIENVVTKNDYMNALSQRHPHLALPAPLVDLRNLAPSNPKPAGRLDLIRQLKDSAKTPR